MNLWTHISWKRLIPWEWNFQGKWYYYFLTISTLYLTSNMNFIPWDLKKSDKTAWPWNLTFTGEIEFWWHIYSFDNLNLIAEGISILCMSLFYTKWRKSNVFEEFWPILYDTSFYFIHFRSFFFRHFVFFWKITS